MTATTTATCSDPALSKTGDDVDEVDSADEALCEMLGLTSLPEKIGGEGCSDDDHETQNAAKEAQSNNNLGDIVTDDSHIREICEKHNLQEIYEKDSVIVFPHELSVPAHVMRRMTDELVWAGERIRVDRTYEMIKVLKHGEISERRVLTRLENFCNSHDEWNELCNNYLRMCVSELVAEPMVLYKEKLNLKPPGGSGFAPHLDSPSLRMAFSEDGPQTFVTVMVAIDSMTETNGCLRVAKGNWNQDNACAVIAPDMDGNPDAGGRAGAIPASVADELNFEDIVVKGGTIVAFNGWAPHRSSSNTSPFARRAVFLTYNRAAEGHVHGEYYANMERKRNEWRAKVGLGSSKNLSPDEQSELDALATIPRI